MPKFDKNKKIIGLGICSVESLYLQVKEGIKKYGIPIETAIKVITSNVADILKLYDKGRIEKGKDADLVIVDENSLDIDIVLCNGIKMVQDGECIVRGTFE